MWETEQEVLGSAKKVTWSLAAFQERCSTKIIQTNTPNFTHVQYKPHGPVVVIGPFNFPVHIPGGHIIPALLAGNTIIFSDISILLIKEYFLQI